MSTQVEGQQGGSWNAQRAASELGWKQGMASYLELQFNSALRI